MFCCQTAGMRQETLRLLTMVSDIHIPSTPRLSVLHLFEIVQFGWPRAYKYTSHLGCLRMWGEGGVLCVALYVVVSVEWCDYPNKAQDTITYVWESRIFTASHRCNLCWCEVNIRAEDCKYEILALPRCIGSSFMGYSNFEFLLCLITCRFK